MQKLISVIMSTYKEPVSWVEQAVTSIINQTYENIELIIVIDDPTNCEVIEYLEELSHRYNYISLIKNEKNEGLVCCLNKALVYAHGDYVARMDADDISLPNRFENEVKTMEEKCLDIVGGFIQYFDDENEYGIGKTCCHPHMMKKYLRYQGGIAHPTWLAKREVFDVANGYRQIDACEDYDFLARALLNGYRLGNTKNVVLKYRVNPNSISHVKENKQQLASMLIGRCYSQHKELNIDEYHDVIASNIRVSKGYLIKKQMISKLYRLIDGLLYK